jgi:hypothetical protein
MIVYSRCCWSMVTALVDGDGMDKAGRPRYERQISRPLK